MGSRDRRALLIGGIVLVASLALRYGIEMIGVLQATRERNQRQSDLRAALERRPSLDVLTDSLAQRVEWLSLTETQLLSSGTPSHVASALHAIVRGAATDVGLTVQSTSAEGDSSSTGPFARAMVRLDAEGDVSNVMQFLLLIELAPGALRTTRLSLSPLEPGAPPDRAETIRLSMTVEGVARRSLGGGREE